MNVVAGCLVLHVLFPIAGKTSFHFEENSLSFLIHAKLRIPSAGAIFVFHWQK